MKYVIKGWGYEKWIVNKKEYCGKLLFFKAGKKCSYHYHKIKDETFYLQKGRMIVRYETEEDYVKRGESQDHFDLRNCLDACNTTILEAGQSFYIPPGMRHQMEAITDCELFEFSTEHFDEDSYRLIKGD